VYGFYAFFLNNVRKAGVSMIREKKRKKAGQKGGGFLHKIVMDYKKHTIIYWMLVPVILYYILFHYVPMGGLVIAFKDYRPARGILNSAWVGLEHFRTFFSSYYFWSLLRNTLTISISSLVFGFPAPIILAILINELRQKRFKKMVQTVTYMPHFISTVVIAGLVVDMVSTDGVITNILAFFGMKPHNLLTVGRLFAPIYVLSDIWQNIGWGTIIYLAALTGISMELYEAAEIDGAGRFRKIINVTLPGITPTIVTLLIMRVGAIMTVGWEKIVLLYNPAIFDQADVISSFVYRNGLLNANYSYSAAVGLFNSIINAILLFLANFVSKKLNETSLW
jgi:putative aldouronate transport system permease protein